MLYNLFEKKLQKSLILIQTIHPKLHKINLHNVPHSLISQNPRVLNFSIQISFLIVTYLYLEKYTLTQII